MSRLPVLHVAIAATLAFAGCGEKDDSIDEQESAAITAAEAAYQQAVAAGTDLTNGPCISEALPGVTGWVADIAHDPRTAVDDDPANQCQSFVNGTAEHFVELTPEGVVIGAE